MATPTNLNRMTRQALAEIPDRLDRIRVATTPTIPERIDRIRVATTPTRRLADEPTPANVLNPTALDNSIANISLNFGSPVPSPDELVIRQRGRRRITLTWSPDKNSSLIGAEVVSSRSPFPKTPTKTTTMPAPLGSPMVLRSSPRKRLLNDFMGNSETGTIAQDKQNNNFSPKKSLVNDDKKVRPSTSSIWTGTPIVKRQKMDTKPLAQTTQDVPLQVQLKGLSQDQLIDIIKKLVKDDEAIEKKVRDEFPMPDITPFEEQLLNIKKNIFKSLPTSRLCQKTDSTAYSRAVTHLSTFKKAIISQSRKLHDSSHWDALLNYVSMAWTYVRATPIWDNNSHNLIRRQCFKILSSHCLASLKNAGVRLGEQRLTDLERDLKEWAKDYEDVLSCVGHLNQIILKIRTAA